MRRRRASPRAARTSKLASRTRSSRSATASRVSRYELGSMESRYVDADAARAVSERAEGVSELLALRTYTARLLGSDPTLVLHGGGNTSVKAQAKDAIG